MVPCRPPAATMAIVFWERGPAAEIPQKAQRQGNGCAAIVCVFHVELGEVPQQEAERYEQQQGRPNVDSDEENEG